MARRKGPTLVQRSRRVPAGEKAVFHHVAGAGRSRVLRPFFDLSSEDVTVLTAELDRRLQTRLAQPARG